MKIKRKIPIIAMISGPIIRAKSETEEGKIIVKIGITTKIRLNDNNDAVAGIYGVVFISLC